jgi:CopG family transcriptional regulator, nickel-responsive regulator
MQRVTISMSDGFAEELEAFMATHGYDNRSEALRDLARSGLDRAQAAEGAAGTCVATLAYVFDQHVREIPRRLAEAYHDHHDLAVATMRVHLDHENCLEVAVLRGDTGPVRDFAKGVIAERGIRHGQVSFIPVDLAVEQHPHGTASAAQPHVHAHPKG